jgi:predicted flavoprotein YhiN
MFPVTDSSATVIDCLMFEAKAAGVELIARNGIEGAERLRRRLRRSPDERRISTV